MKNKRLFKLMQVMFLFAVFSIVLGSCKKDDPVTDDPIASFQFEVSETDFSVVTFTNYSQNATSYSWDFGDSETSTEENPVHTYAAEGTFTVTLTASNADGVSSTFSDDVTITDPDVAYKLLTGDVSKTWKLFREGVAASSGSSSSNPQEWYTLMNDGKRPCLYEHTWTFHFDGSMVFDDGGSFWAEYAVFNNTGTCTDNTTPEGCFEAIAANMVNECGDDVSAWLSGTHSFAYDVPTGKITLTGDGAWIGVVKLGETDYRTTPTASTACNITITEHTGYDLMTCVFEYAAGDYWTQTYVSYSDPSLEPDLVTEAPGWGEDLPDITPASGDLGHTFESAASGSGLDTIASGSTVVYGVADPAGGGTNVGEFTRTADVEFQELIIQTSPDKQDIQFNNLTTVSLDVYIPSAQYASAASLTKDVRIGFSDKSATEQWWTVLIEYLQADVATDQWVTVTFNLDSPSYASLGDTPFDRTDLDMIYINIGSSGHTDGGIFYVRNLVLN